MEGLDDAELNGPDAPESTVDAHRSSPDRTVFTESGNPDAWIAVDTDATLDLER
ncbi:hypothetical protein C474_19219 [Halogeometricum pallidum JCM 14848]|uniref:Uncharacterized protein n=1 Tax=Halogeometricum pallidum JCM 14848 TaxID=1227487 RepID=M0CTN3_HALPD|nr:hypothetical protein [Halogeometricum pallidum]ELZ26561.1 hypothetical protein C474_19219 [Halogeometricum pallidum JCM 14848]